MRLYHAVQDSPSSKMKLITRVMTKYSCAGDSPTVYMDTDKVIIDDRLKRSKLVIKGAKPHNLSELTPFPILQLIGHN